MLKKMYTLALASAIALGIFLGSAQAGEAKKVLYFIPIVDTGAYWSLMKVGAIDKANELDYELVIRTSPPSESQKNEKHIGFLNEAIMHNAAAIAIAPMDPDMFDRKVRGAKEAGIPVVTFDADVATKKNRVSYIGTDNYQAGVVLGEKGAEYIKNKGITSGSIALVSTNLTQTTMINRQNGIKEGFDRVMGADAANFKWLEGIVDDDQSSVSKRQLEGQLVANPDLAVVFSLGSEGPDTGVMEAIKSQERAGSVCHFGFDYTPTWENGIAAGLITGIVDQDAYSIGTQVVQAMADAIDGKDVPDNVGIDAQWILADELIEYGKRKQAVMNN